jgi:DNA recombination protein RmuC
MTTVILALIPALLSLANLVLLVILLRRTSGVPEGSGTLQTELRLGREESRDMRAEVLRQIMHVDETLRSALAGHAELQQSTQARIGGLLTQLTDSTRSASDAQRTMLDGRIRDLQEGNDRRLAEIRLDMSSGIKGSAEGITGALELMRGTQERSLTGMSEQLRQLSGANQEALDRVRAALDARMKELQTSNEHKLEEMRRTVDEKLHEALEKRLGESFRLVSERLESVHKGLGEMQSLASGVGDLKRVLTNVKTRGTWAEVQLGAILEQMLTPEQFERNVRVKPDTSERVEFAVRLPGPKDDPGACVYLPIDSKFPHEDYARLQSASELGDPEGVRAATDALLRAMRLSAREIHDKYVDPPATTDFAIMFLATEGLYAEALRQSGFLEELQQQHRIVLAGPTTLSAILSSLRMGFQTLAVEKHAAEVWQVLAGVKSEFGRFGSLLDKVQEQLQRASNTLQETGKRTKLMERQLRKVEQLGTPESAQIFRLPGMPELDPEENGEGPAAGDTG